MLLRFLSAIEFITGSEFLVIRSYEGAYGDTPQRKFHFQETIVETNNIFKYLDAQIMFQHDGSSQVSKRPSVFRVST